MGKHKSVEARRLTELGQGLYAWSDVLFNGGSVYDSSAKSAMRELAQMEDTPENRELLQKAAYRCGLPEREAEALASWVENDDPLLNMLWNMLPGDHSMFGMQHDMRAELAEYVKGEWPDIRELADLLEERDDDVVKSWRMELVPETQTIHAARNGHLLVAWLDKKAAESIAMSCPDLDNPPIGVVMVWTLEVDEHVVCATVDQAVDAVVDRIHRLDMEGK